MRVVTWLLDHPALPAFLLIVLTVSFSKLPPPKNKRLRWLWVIAARLSFGAWDVWGVGRLKLPGTLGPRPPWEANPNWPDDPPSELKVDAITIVPPATVMMPSPDLDDPPPTPRDPPKA